MTPITTPLKSNRINEIVQSWYANYISDIVAAVAVAAVADQHTLLFELVTAANFMDIKSLLDLSCLAVSILIQGKTAHEIRGIFNISNELVVVVHHNSNNNDNNNNYTTTTALSSTTTMTAASSATAAATDPPLGVGRGVSVCVCDD